MTAAQDYHSPSEGVPFYTEKGNAKPRAVQGRFRTYKWWLMAATLAWWHLAPFLRWDRGPYSPHQAILIDMAGRRAYFFNIEIWPQEVYYLTGLLLIAAITLFMMSAVAGRVWCGFLCWQTVYTDLFVSVERKVLGDRNKRIAFSQAPFSLGKLGKLALLNAVWLIIAAACGIGFVLWFGDAPHLLVQILTLQAPPGMYLFIGLIGGFCFLLAGYARERVCVYMCPYARFQSAMFDEHSLIVSYEAWRGEPRGPLKGGIQGRDPKEVFQDRGHCVDCQMCVQACPTGIDIRRGTQLACIGCGLCVDACNSVMERFGLPRNLISYDSSYNLQARPAGLEPRLRLVRPRTLIYAAVLVVAGSAMLGTLLMRPDMRVDVLHVRVPLAVAVSGGRVRNGYDYKVLNMARHPRTVTLRAIDPANVSLDVVGGGSGSAVTLQIPADNVATFHIFTTSHSHPEGNEAVTFQLTEPGHPKVDIRNVSFMAQPD